MRHADNSNSCQDCHHEVWHTYSVEVSPGQVAGRSVYYAARNSWGGRCYNCAVAAAAEANRRERV